MIEIVDHGVRSAAEQAIGHPPPFSANELDAVAELRVLHAEELGELRHCTGLTTLELTACAIRTLDDVAGLDRLEKLRVLACPVEDAGPLAGHAALAEISLDFCFLTDLAPLTTVGGLRRGRFLGNPIEPASWHEIRPAWQRSRSGGRLRLLEFGPAEAWEFAREAWEHDVRICCGLLDGLRPVLVRPGIPDSPGVTVEAVHGFGGAVVAAARRGESTDDIYRRNRDWAAGQGLDRPADFGSHRTLGDAEDARSWVSGTPDAEALERFVAHFPDTVFYREDDVVHAAMAGLAGVPVPEAVAASRSVLAGILPDDRVQFRIIEPRPTADVWYLPVPGAYDTDERRELIRDQAGLFPLAEWVETGHSILAARLADDDPAVYEFDEHEMTVTRRRGQPLTDSTHRVAASHADLLSRIAVYRLSDGTEMPAVLDTEGTTGR
ncbi:hypothetical protein QLQ12_36560 [Actinoplanes sp. NEAU-A12]|uniref:Leucine rich repeat (LRR) protein n=1 Tax=Actinoplanes sandaracinus TaxID=3045177 RepID=A0ABT6WWQ2_9ACTN|nr:hypothetical protein [Actinoplanes sandaracinus]MDI6104119.1 hypothetical protein [Actinoplanes sandaracinus]